MAPLRRIFYYVRKIIGLFIFLARTKLVSNKIVRLRKEQMALIQELMRLKKVGKPTDAIQLQIADLNRKITKMTMKFVRLGNGKGKRLHNIG